MASRATRAIIVGGGIGGLSAAVALRRAGIEAAVFEQQTELRRTQVGGGIHMWTNAMRALRELGLDQRVRELGAVVERTEYRTSRGALLATWPLDAIGREHGLQDVGITRGELQEVLVEAQDEASVHSGAQCVAFEQDRTGVTVRFSDGREERGDMLVGADGLRSTVRAQLHGEQPLRYARYAQVQSLADRGPDLLPRGTERILFGRGNRAVLHHVGSSRLFWAAAVYVPEGYLAGVEARREFLLERFRGWERPIEEAIESTAESMIVGFDIYDRPPLERWGDGRVTLLGDAAHPMTTNLSQGGCQALEDSVVLARLVRDADDLPAALRAYESARRPRTAALVKRSHRIARAGGLRNPIAAAVRDRIFGFGLGGPALKEHRRFVADAP
jgi:2-polyprenyl-6-methoxyphenol hydroxylase-like FAD-dependent oxidoreductase